MSQAYPERKLPAARLALAILVTVLALVLAVLSAAIPQDVAYHAFGDHRHLLGVDNFWNVVSNAPFVFVGILGLHECWRQTRGGKMPHVAVYEVPGVVITFFIGVLLTGIGSAYYHLNPNNETLIWDRLPMTISFMAFFTMVIGCHLNFAMARKVAIPLLMTGLASVLYWSYTQAQGAGDLRAYALVQFLPIALVPILIVGSKSEGLSANTIWKVIGWYVLAKALEHWDVQIFHVLGSEVSGHAVKHVAAAFATWIIYREIHRATGFGWHPQIWPTRVMRGTTLVGK